jgi:amphi-Trp domain-containing protein
MGDRREFEFEGAASPGEAARTLTLIAAGLRARGLSLSCRDDRIALHPSGDLSLAVEARERNGKAKIEIAIAWRRSDDDGE